MGQCNLTSCWATKIIKIPSKVFQHITKIYSEVWMLKCNRAGKKNHLCQPKLTWVLGSAKSQENNCPGDCKLGIIFSYFLGWKQKATKLCLETPLRLVYLLKLFYKWRQLLLRTIHNQLRLKRTQHEKAKLKKNFFCTFFFSQQTSSVILAKLPVRWFKYELGRVPILKLFTICMGKINAETMN